ncbi:MAG: 6-bladed beta-propeller [Bacteroidales bacterium]|nr:6-bladed beta-propeller [Bacteroidales bacterium]
MGIKNSLLIVIIIILVYGCSSKSNDGNSNPTLKLVGSFEDYNLTGDVNIETDVSFIKLDNAKECLLGYVMNLDVIDSNLYILDENTLYLFNIQGEFVKKIKRGKGPGELTNAMNFSIDKTRKQITVIEQGNTLHLYKLDLEHIESYHLEGSFTDAVRVDENNFLLHSAYPGKYEDHMLSMFDINNKRITKKCIPNKSFPLREFSLLTYNNFQSYNDQLYWYSANSRRIYKYFAEDFVGCCMIDFEDKEPTVSYISKFSKPMAFKKQAYEDGYIGFINYYYMFSKFKLIGLKYKEYGCGIAFNDKPEDIYLGTIADLFGLPKTSSFRSPTNVVNNDLYFVYYNDILLESNETTLPLVIGEKKISLEENSNPTVVVVSVH